MASIAWLICSCEEFCEESNRTAVVVSFYFSDTNPVKKFTIRGIENDSLLYSQANLSQVLLPVNPSADIMSFSIKNDTLPADTIIIHYNRHYGFISPECGCVTYAEILEEPEITRNSVTDLEVANPNVTTVSYRQGVFNAENIRIYY